MANGDDLPLSTRFTLGPTITAEQRTFLDRHGFILFSRVARRDEVAMLGSEIERIEAAWLAEGRRRVFGIPLFVGRDHESRPFIQRLAFTSMFSDKIRTFVRDPRFLPILDLIGAQARVGDSEKDGVVVNRYLNVPGSVHPRLGWHTDGLRDLFYGRMPQPMLNIGLHLDRCTPENGGLRLIPGSHNQGFFSMCFRKAYFVSHRPDPAEHCVETEPGDLTVHDGRLWHRVARSTLNGAASLRRSMYLPCLTGPYEPKDEDSPTPAYHRVGEWLRNRTARGVNTAASDDLTRGG
jgi:ectoine hydroxylase-related dioxygenase (phytanoyl-CoA dioxygenase family)